MRSLRRTTVRKGLPVALVTAISVAVGLTAAPASGAPHVNWPAYLHDAGHTSRDAAATAITPAEASHLRAAWTWKPGRPTITGQPGATLTASPTVYNGVVYIGAGTGVFYALDESTGKVIWQRLIAFVPKLTCGAMGFSSTATVAPDPTTKKPVVYVGAADGYLYALDAAEDAPCSVELR